MRIVPPPSEVGAAPAFRSTWKWADVRSLAEYRELHVAIIAEYLERDAASVPGVAVPLFPSSANWSGTAALERGELGDEMTTVRLRTLRGKFERYTQSLLAQPWVLELEDVGRFIGVRLTADDPALEREPEPAPDPLKAADGGWCAAMLDAEAKVASGWSASGPEYGGQCHGIRHMLCSTSDVLKVVDIQAPHAEGYFTQAINDSDRIVMGLS